MLKVERRINIKKVISVLIIAVCLLSVSVFVFVHSMRATTVSSIKNDSTIKVQPKISSVSSNILFTGNVYWGRYINDWSMKSPLQYSYPFSRLNEFDRLSYNAWISGLECPIVDGVNLTSAEEDSTLSFNCSSKYLPEASKWFSAFTLANNHTDNQGADGFEETKRHLSENGIQYFGNPDPDVLDDICEVISIPVNVVDDGSVASTGKIPIATCAYHLVFKLPTDEAIAQISNYSPYLPVFVLPHMGVEYKSSPDELKTDFYHAFIDAGADAVLGDHPHWIQNSESYKGHLIMYSMGNFIFDQQDSVEVTRSAAVKVNLSIDSNNQDLIKKWLKLGEKCADFKDNCLDEIKSLKLEKLDIKYDFSIVGTSDASKIVKPATPSEQTDILNRLNWSNTIKNLQSPYSGL